MKSEWKSVLNIDDICLHTALIVRIAYCVKGKKISFSLNHAMRTRRESTVSLTSALDGGWVVNILILRAACGLQSPPFCIFIMLPQCDEK